MRKCVSYSDLGARHFEQSQEAAATDVELRCSDMGDCKPLKRSRSDQSLTDVQQAAYTADAASMHPGAARRTTAATQKQGLQRLQHSPYLPVVFSDAGSCSSSSPRLDPEVPSSAFQQQLSEQISSNSPAAALAGARELQAFLDSPAAPQGQYPLSPSEADIVSAVSKRSHRPLYSLANCSSAASLTQYAYAGSGTLERTSSDASVSSTGGQSYLARLQQLVPPLPPYSPPPLFSPWPSLTASATSLLASLNEHGTGWCGNISNNLQQEQAVFNVSAAATTGHSSSSATGAVLTGHGVAGQRLAIPSIGSMDSITSVEAGEHLLGYAHTVAGGSSGVTEQAGTRKTLGVLDGGAISGRQLSGQLRRQNHAGPKQQVSSGQQQAIDATAPVALNTPRTFVQAAVCTTTGLPESTRTHSSKPPRHASSPLTQVVNNTSEPQQLPQQLEQQSAGSLFSKCSYTLSSGPLQLQTVSSMLGCEVDQLLLLPEHSTGAIYPSHFVKLQSAAGIAATTATTSSGSTQSSTSVTAHEAAAAYSSGQQTSRARCPGHDTGMPQSPVGTTPASHSIASSAAIASWASGAAGDSNSATVFLPVVLPNALHSVDHSLGATPSSFSTAAPALQETARAFGFRQSTSITAGGPAGAVRAIQGAAAAVAAAAAAQALTPVWRGAAVAWPAAGSSDVPGSAPLPHLQAEDKQQCWSVASPTWSGAVQTSGGARQGPGTWSFTRRPASCDCERPLSGRTRGSLELNMPWRTKLDAVIAQVTADALEPPPQPAVSTAQPGSSLLSSAPAGRSADGATDDSTSNDDPFSCFAAMEAVTNGLRHHVGCSMSQQQGSGLLLPLLESDQEQQGPPAAAAGSEGELTGAGGAASTPTALSSEWQPSPASTPNSSSNRGARTNSTFSSTSSGTLPDDLAAGSMVGGYLGASEMARGGSASWSELEAARSYGLEFDGAVVMQNVDLTAVGSHWSDAMELTARVHLQQQQQEQPVAGTVTEGRQPRENSLEHVQPLSQQQQQQLASLGSLCVESRLRLRPGIWQQPHPHERLAQGTDDLVLDCHSPHHAADSSTWEQLEQQPQQLGADRQQRGPADDTHSSKPQILPAVSPNVRDHLASTNSFSSSISSISNRSSAGVYGRRCAGSSSSSAAYELFVRLHRARQALDFAKRQAELFAELDRAELGVWEALDLLNGMRDYEALLLLGVKSSARSSSSGGSGNGVLDGSRSSFSDGGVTPDMPLKEHALQVAELCRLSFPHKPWMALVGLIHGLGKLLAHPIFGGQPQWAVAGESYPLGCKFAAQISHSEFFSANPDRRRRAYSSALGIYKAGCGLRNVYMSWGAPEYLYMLLVLNQTDLPEEALFMIRYQRCAALTRPGGAYRQLMSDLDKSLLPLLAAFQGLIAYKRIQLPPQALQGKELIAYYDKLIAQYLGEDKLFW